MDGEALGHRRPATELPAPRGLLGQGRGDQPAGCEPGWARGLPRTRPWGCAAERWLVGGSWIFCVLFLGFHLCLVFACEPLFTDEII